VAVPVIVLAMVFVIIPQIHALFVRE
jgi:hypothetical protein